MKLFINSSIFLSIIEEEEKFSCLPMELIHGIGMQKATLFDRNKSDIVSATYKDYEPKILSSFSDVCDYHKNLLETILED